MGAWFAVVVVVRPQDGLFLIFPLAALLFAPLQRTLPFQDRVKTGVHMLLGAVPLLLLQSIMLAHLLSASSFKLVGDDGYLNIFSSE